ncbi:MAG: class I SAM-dependent methyltransferase [Rhodospirillales bacterium]|nr:class I SAM-dependent methyltransferase [Rhodospirillales bacterium]
MPYTNSAHDQNADDNGRAEDEGAVRRMYETAPYPDLGADPKDGRAQFEPVLRHLGRRRELRFLDVGCGTGHLLVGTAKAYPDWLCHGLDLSAPSLAVAKELAERHNVKVSLARGSYLDPLPFETKTFDIISAQGTIHHTADPVAALTALRGALADDGLLSMHLYGLRLDQRKFDTKDILSIFEPDLFNHERRFRLYDQLMRFQDRWTLRRLASLSPLDVYITTRNWLHNLMRRGRRVSWSPPWTDRYSEPDSPWIDHFCHPCERAYEVPDIRELVTASGFEVVEMLGQGRDDPRWLPPEWKTHYDKLDPWDRYRLMELLNPYPLSFRMILRKTA